MKSVQQWVAFAAIWLLAAALPAPAQSSTSTEPETPEQRDQRMQWWREARFGLFIHWGPISLKGTEIGWSRGGERRGQGSGRGEVPVEIYDNLYKQFNPVQFNADEWVQLAKDAGMKYLVFTTKHHDGFCEFDSKLTDYRITSPESPFRRDVVKELADACHKAGLRLGFYYSPPDWHHPDYRTENHARYIEYLHGQLRELCTNYGKVDIIWFDGLGGTAKDWDAERLLGMIRTLQPGVIINNRAGLPADHDTPEQEIGNFQKDRPWETCMTICRQWAWKPNDELKSFKECIQTLVRTAGGDGNLLFNVGPMPEGRIEPRQVDRLREMGEWLKRNGETIYGTRGGPFKYSPMASGNYTSTCKGNRIFLHVLSWPKDDAPLTLPPIGKKILKSQIMAGGPADVRQRNEGITVSVPARDRDEIDTIIVMEVDGSAVVIPPVALKSTSLAGGKPAQASNVFLKMEKFGADKAFDGDLETRWATDEGTHEAWLEVDLGSPQLIAEAFISEACGHRVQKFELQREVGGKWEPFVRGKRIGQEGHFQPAVDVGVAVDHVGHAVDQLDDALGNHVTGRRLAANQYATVGPAIQPSAVDAVVQMDHMQHVEQLPLVFMDALDLYVEQRVGVEFHAAFGFDERRQAHLVGALDATPLRVKFRVFQVRQRLQFLQLAQVGHPGVADLAADERAHAGVGVCHPAPRRDAIGLVVELVRP